MPVTIKPKQSLGQNFLIDENIARNIVREMHLKPSDIVMEVGPGQGALTKFLAGKAKHLIAFEIDKRVVVKLQEKYHSESVSIIHEDFLNVSLTKWKREFKSKLRVVGNIPYHLTSPILFKVFEDRKAVIDLTIMIQKEVAKRITAEPNTKDYGILSVFSQHYGIPTYLFDVSSNCFYPKPKVTSAVIHIQIFEKLPYSIDDELFRLVVKTAFGKRRKILRNSLRYLPYDENSVQRIFKDVNFDFATRPEQLSVEQFVFLTKQIEKVIE